MAYAQIEVSAIRHPKVLTLSDAAFRLWVAGLCYSQEHLTDGQIPAAALYVLGVKVTDALVAELVDHHLWDADGAGGYAVHDYLAWNRSRDAVGRDREAARLRAAAARERAYARAAERAPARAVERSTNVPCVAVRTSTTTSTEQTGRIRAATALPRYDPSSPFSWTIAVPGKLHREFVQRESSRHHGDVEAAEAGLLDWYATVAEAWNDQPLPGDDGFRFWRNRYAEWRGVSQTTVPDAKRAAVAAWGREAS